VSNPRTADFLVELGTEELPPKALLKLRDAFSAGVGRGLSEARLGHAQIQSFATPRRLALIVPSLELNQPPQKIENRGPPVAIAFDDTGKATKAAEAFASKCGVSVGELTTQTTEKGEWLYYSGEQPGLAAADLLGDIVNAALAALPIPRRMRWGSRSVEFVRPAHWLVMLLGKDIVAATALGLTAGRQTYGHRFHAPGAIELATAADYVDTLREHGYVIVDCAERQALIVAAANDAATAAGGEAVLEPTVVEEVTALVEWPVPVVGNFDAGFLRLPPEVLISTLQDHQRYFPLQKDAALMPAFITISNLQSSEPDEVRRGNERVVLPRLADAAFFWDQDSAVTLAERMPLLATVVYQQGLGSLQDKSRRVGQLGGLVAGYLKADLGIVTRAAELARTDLLTDMVGEFPELQGRMGYYYANNDGEPAGVAVAIEEQYLPRHAGDRLPGSKEGQALGLADRLDTLAGIFALGKRPSGNKDPFGLRRQALGIVRILIECGIDVDLPALLNAAVELQPASKKAASLADELYAFIMERMRTWYISGQAPGIDAGDISIEMFDAVLSRAPSSPLDFHQRLEAVQRFMGLPAAESLTAANKRIANILKKAEGGARKGISVELFEGQEEAALHDAVNAIVAGHKTDLENRNYENALQRLAALREPVDDYFDQVMVMSDDENRRSNRLAQLEQLRALFLAVADISSIPSSHQQ
jgi:glycyl-tRNA synthetase beta chain